MARHHRRPFQPYRLALSGSVHPCTLPDASFCCAKTSLLLGTTDIPVRSDTLSIYSCEGLIPRRLRRGCWFGTIFGWLWSRNFELNYEENLIRLYEDLKNRKWQPGKSNCFIVTKPVRREIFAAPFRDRIVHHILIGRLNTAFEKYFIPDSYAKNLL